MNSSKLNSTISKNSRQYESALRELERQCAEASALEVMIELSLTTRLSELAAFEIDHNADLCSEADHQLRLRADEEQSLRNQLATYEKQIAEKLHLSEMAKKDIDEAKVKARLIIDADPDTAARAKQYDIDQADAASFAATYSDTIEECKTKLHVYKDNALYSYLRSSGYGSSEYQSSGISARLDGWVAKLCNFKVNRANEVTLQGMLDELDKQVAERNDRIQDAEKVLARRLLAADTAVGLDSLTDVLNRLEAAISELKSRSNEIHPSLVEYAERRDFRYVRARDIVAEFLRSQSIDDLVKQASETPEPEDDVLVRKIVVAKNDLDGHRAKYQAAYAARAKADEAFNRAKVLERALRRYTGNEYEFKNELDIDSALQGYMAGSITSDAVIKEVSEHRKLIPVQSYANYSGSRTYRGSSAARSSSSSRGSSTTVYQDDSPSGGWGGGSSDGGGGNTYDTSGSFGGDSYSTTDSI